MIPTMVGLWLGTFATLAPASERETPVVLAVRRATPGVVTVEVEVDATGLFSFGTRRASQGSGVVISEDGLVLTNAHVVAGARRISVHSDRGTGYEARVMAVEPDLDLAVLKIEGADRLAPVSIGDSNDLMLGETVIAIGNPLGLGLTVSTGVVASVRRDLEITPGIQQSFVQTDAAINPGNSGGALVNINGELIGINTAIRADAQGIGFAIPVNRAMKVAADLVNYGAVRAPWLGIDVRDLDPRRRVAAVRISGVAPSGPGAKVGLKPGDLVTGIEDRPVTSRAELNARLAERKPGDRIRLTTVRDNRYAEVTLATTAVPSGLGKQLLERRIGIEVKATPQGLLVMAMKGRGAWALANLRIGDLIVAVDGQLTEKPSELEAALRRAQARHRGQALFTVRRGAAQGHIPLALR
ncbi:MAG: trypsin-like peptidase domain-containing protein [Myxococcota bacterium]